MKSKNNFYTVWVGRSPGVYSSWDTCKAQVNGYKNAAFKGFVNYEKALEAFNSDSDSYIGQKAPTLSDKKIYAKRKPLNHPFRRGVR
jgi:ribonuclease HI